MFFGRSLLLLNSALNLEAAFLQVLRQFILQIFERGPGVNVLGAQSAIFGNRHMQKMHVRSFFIHVHHCRDDIFLADKFREIICRFFKKAPGFIRIERLKKRLVRTDDNSAHMHGIFPDSFHHQQVVNPVLDGLQVVS